LIDLLLKPEKSFSNGIAIIIDVLRATSTIVTALCNGAPFVLPVRTLSQARKLRNGSCEKRPLSLAESVEVSNPRTSIWVILPSNTRNQRLMVEELS